MKLWEKGQSDKRLQNLYGISFLIVHFCLKFHYKKLTQHCISVCFQLSPMSFWAPCRPLLVIHPPWLAASSSSTLKKSQWSGTSTERKSLMESLPLTCCRAVTGTTRSTPTWSTHLGESSSWFRTITGTRSWFQLFGRTRDAWCWYKYWLLVPTHGLSTQLVLIELCAIIAPWY